ncbi:hypothetical protein ACOSP7_020926 [Xanthoceras sorbifolium]
MLYLLVFCRSMLPKGFGDTRYEATSAEIIDIFETRNDITNESKVREALVQHYPHSYIESRLEEVRAGNVGMGEYEPLLKYGCILYGQLQEDPRIQEKGKWKIISEVWVEMLGYAAHNCGWKLHCQQLRKGGGELLTHVCLLMAHLGLTEHYEVH